MLTGTLTGTGTKPPSISPEGGGTTGTLTGTGTEPGGLNLKVVRQLSLTLSLFDSARQLSLTLALL